MATYAIAAALLPQAPVRVVHQGRHGSQGLVAGWACRDMLFCCPPSAPLCWPSPCRYAFAFGMKDTEKGGNPFIGNWNFVSGVCFSATHRELTPGTPVLASTGPVFSARGAGAQVLDAPNLQAPQRVSSQRCPSCALCRP